MSRKGENIYKRKDGRWEGRYIKSREVNGRALYGYVYARTYREVKGKLRDKIQEKEKNSPGHHEYSKEKEVFENMAVQWLEHERFQMKESTYVKYFNTLSSYVFPTLGKTLLSKITVLDIDNLCVRLLKSGGKNAQGLSPKTVTDILSLIRSILKFASNKGYSVSFDMKAISIKQNPKEMRILTKKEQQVLSQFIFANPTLKNLGILICLFTGIRIGEICALRWEDISLSEKTLFIHQTMQRIQSVEGMDKKTKIIITSPKSKCSIRTIPLPDEIIEFLNIKEQQPYGYFLTGSNMKLIEPRTMQNHFKNVLKQCGIQEVNYHALRHTFATRCVELEFDVKSLSEILGHANVNITMNRYVHPTLELKRTNMDRLSSLLNVT